MKRNRKSSDQFPALVVPNHVHQFMRRGRFVGFRTRKQRLEKYRETDREHKKCRMFCFHFTLGFVVSVFESIKYIKNEQIKEEPLASIAVAEPPRQNRERLCQLFERKLLIFLKPFKFLGLLGIF